MIKFKEEKESLRFVNSLDYDRERRQYKEEAETARNLLLILKKIKDSKEDIYYSNRDMVLIEGMLNLIRRELQTKAQKMKAAESVGSKMSDTENVTKQDKKFIKAYKKKLKEIAKSDSFVKRKIGKQKIETYFGKARMKDYFYGPKYKSLQEQIHEITNYVVDFGQKLAFKNTVDRDKVKVKDLFRELLQHEINLKNDHTVTV